MTQVITYAITVFVSSNNAGIKTGDTNMGNNEVLEIKSLGNSSTTAKEISKYLAGRERMRHETDLNRIKTVLKADGRKIDDKEYDAFWKNAEKLELGSVDKKGRFRWHFNLKTVGQIALGDSPEEALVKLEAAKKARPSLSGVSVQSITRKPSGESKVAFAVANQFVFLPMNMNQEEADKLAEFIKKIPTMSK